MGFSRRYEISRIRVCVMMSGEYVAISAAIGTVLVACVVMFCQLENMMKKRHSAIRAIRQAEEEALIHRLRTYISPKGNVHLD
jgi:hypothetical protein